MKSPVSPQKESALSVVTQEQGKPTHNPLQLKTLLQGPKQNPLQAGAATTSGLSNPLQPMTSSTGLPEQLKAGIENLSGYSMDDVKVHYNSSRPALVQALAFAHGTDIHIAPGQEQHLPHEAWHVVQQKQGRVQPTIQMPGGLSINDNGILENEAERMGNLAVGTTAPFMDSAKETVSAKSDTPAVIQCFPPNNYRVHGHFRQRMRQRRISENSVDDIVNNGAVYSDTAMPGATIYYKNGTAVVHDGRQLKTCYGGRVKNRWVLQ